MNNKRKRNIKILFAAIILLIVAFVVMFFKEVIVDIIRLTKQGDKEAIKQFMKEKGWIGYVSVIVVEALEMVVVFAPAELIQIPAGISFPPYIAIILCDLGVIIGASLVYYLVNTLGVKTDYIAKKQVKIVELERKKNAKNTQMLMYLLYITPIVPLGAICYFGSSKKIGYKKYIFTCATGAIPSIVTSILISTGVKYYLGANIPLWSLLLIIAAFVLLLFLVSYTVTKKVFFKKETKNNPNSPFYFPLINLYGMQVRKRSKPKYLFDEKYYEMLNLEMPVLFLCNHFSPDDVYHTLNFIKPLRAAMVANRYYTRTKLGAWLFKKIGFIPKGLFNFETAPLKEMMKDIKKGISVFMFPEARLSLDGTTNPLTNGIESLVKQLNVPVVVLNINGSFLAKSKYHTTKGKVPVQVKVNDIIYPDNFNKLDKNDLRALLSKDLTVSEYDYSTNIDIKDPNIASNLESVLYKCPECKQDYKMHSEGRKIYCDCGFNLTLDNHYQFLPNKQEFKNPHDYYKFIKEVERNNYLNTQSDIIYQEEVDLVKIDLDHTGEEITGKGIATITKDGFSYVGTVGKEHKEFKSSLKALQCLAFGVNEEYECYFENGFYWFYPTKNRKSCTKVSLLYDLVQETYNK